MFSINKQVVVNDVKMHWCKIIKNRLKILNKEMFDEEISGYETSMYFYELLDEWKSLQKKQEIYDITKISEKNLLEIILTRKKTNLHEDIIYYISLYLEEE